MAGVKCASYVLSSNPVLGVGVGVDVDVDVDVDVEVEVEVEVCSGIRYCQKFGW